MRQPERGSQRGHPFARPNLAAVLHDYLRHLGQQDCATALEELAIMIDGWHPRDGYGR